MGRSREPQPRTGCLLLATVLRAVFYNPMHRCGDRAEELSAYLAGVHFIVAPGTQSVTAALEAAAQDPQHPQNATKRFQVTNKKLEEATQEQTGDATRFIRVQATYNKPGKDETHTAERDANPYIELIDPPAVHLM